MDSKAEQILSLLDKDTREHSMRVAAMAMSIAQETETVHNVSDVYLAGLLHDVGKMYVSNLINKPRRLTDKEKYIVDTHAYLGYKTLKNMGYSSNIVIPVLYHHGTEKPIFESIEDTITEEDMQVAKIIHVADVYDAMATKRVYHEPFSFADITKEIRQDTFAEQEHIDILFRLTGHQPFTESGIVLFA